MSFPEAETIVQLAFAALGGGTLYKIVDVLARKKSINAKAYAIKSDAIMQQVDRLMEEAKRANETAERFRKEFEECRTNFNEVTRKVSALEVAQTDLKIDARKWYSYMTTHLEKCTVKETAEPPRVPKILIE